LSAPARTFFGHPAGLATVFVLEMWERASFYGMRALLVLFLVHSVATGGFGLDVPTAAAIYGLYLGGTYIACLPGGWIGDRLLGSQRAVLLGGIIITCGHLLLGFADSRAVFFLGLLVIVLGTGLIKPNAGAIVAQLYPEGGAPLDAGFTIYYVGVNVGATVGPLVTGLLQVRYGFSYGFMAAAIGMAAGVLQFLWSRRFLGDAGREPTAHSATLSAASAARRGLPWLYAGLLALAGVVVVLWVGWLPFSATAVLGFSTQIVVAIALLYYLYLLFGAGLEPVERRRVWVVMLLFVASALFWAGDEQAGSSFNLFADRFTARGLWGFTIPAAWFQSLNPVFIVVFGPLFSWLWIWLGRRNLDPSMPLKFVFGLLGMALGFLVMAAAARVVLSGVLAGMGWLTLTYLLHTWGELCISPVGLSAVSKLVPRRFVGQSIGVWFVSFSLGELIAGRIAGSFDPEHVATISGLYMRVFWFGTLSAALLIVLLPLLRRWMAGVK
jgi:proton-dependent oligopeptide transporter, POT family